MYLADPGVVPGTVNKQQAGQETELGDRKVGTVGGLQIKKYRYVSKSSEHCCTLSSMNILHSCYLKALIARNSNAHRCFLDHCYIVSTVADGQGYRFCVLGDLEQGVGLKQVRVPTQGLLYILTFLPPHTSQATETSAAEAQDLRARA